MGQQNNLNSNEHVFNEFRICRGCLASNCNMRYIFDGNLKENYTSVSNLQISPTDSLPEWLCWKCCALVKKFVVFKSICSQSAAILLKYYSKTNLRVSNRLIKRERECFPKFFLAVSNIFVTHYQPAEHVSEDYVISNKLVDKALISQVLPEQAESDIKEEAKGDNDSWYGEEMGEEIDDTSPLAEVMKVEYDEEFNDSDDEPVIKKIKLKKTKLNRGRRKNQELSEESSNVKRERKKVYNTPAKNFDMSMVIISSLTTEEQLQEMEDSRNSEEYAKAPYKCEMCAKWFVHEIVYKEHTMKHDPVSGQFMCELCSQRFNSRRNLTNHQETHANRYSCRMCNKVVISKQNIMSHMYTEHDQTNKQITCDMCQKTYKNRYTYAKHMRIHNNSKEYKCHLCPKVFLWKDNLNRHLTRHKSERPFTCDQCPKSFFLKENLKDHRLVHSGSKVFYCVECDLSYATQVKLNQHLKRGTKHLLPEQLTFPCNLCDVRYTNSLQLSMHIDRVHLNKRSHMCQQCDAAFVSKKTLQTHIRAIHEGYRKPRDHICETCGKGFSDKQVLKAHIRTHTGEKPFSCKYCSVKFAHSGAMYTHVKLVHLKLKRGLGRGKKKANGKKTDENETNLENNLTEEKILMETPESGMIVDPTSHVLVSPFVNGISNASLREII